MKIFTNDVFVTKVTINNLFHTLHTVNKLISNNLTAIVTTQVTDKRISEIKRLELVLDKLNYSEHEQPISNSLIKYYGILNHIKYKVNDKTARLLYFAFVFSLLKYGLKIYGNCSERNIDKY